MRFDKTSAFKWWKGPADTPSQKRDKQRERLEMKKHRIPKRGVRKKGMRKEGTETHVPEGAGIKREAYLPTSIDQIGSHKGLPPICDSNAGLPACDDGVRE